MKYTDTWTEEKVDFLRKEYGKGAEISKLTEKFNSEFGTRCTGQTINHVLYQAGIKLTREEMKARNMVTCAQNARIHAKKYDLKRGCTYDILEKNQTSEEFKKIDDNMRFEYMNDRLMWFRSPCGHMTTYMRNNNIIRCINC